MELIIFTKYGPRGGGVFGLFTIVPLLYPDKPNLELLNSLLKYQLFLCKRTHDLLISPYGINISNSAFFEPFLLHYKTSTNLWLGGKGTSFPPPLPTRRLTCEEGRERSDKPDLLAAGQGSLVSLSRLKFRHLFLSGHSLQGFPIPYESRYISAGNICILNVPFKVVFFLVT